MKRKVVQHGPSTLTISLPMGWIRRHRVEKGHELEVEEHGDGLQVEIPKQGQPLKQITIDVQNLSTETLKSILAVLHKAGYEEISIHFSGPAQLAVIKERVRTMLMGYELIAESSSTCRIQTIASDEAEQFENVLRRAFLVTLEMAERANAALAGDAAAAGAVLELEQTNNRLTNFCHRILNRGAVAADRMAYYYIISWLLESIGDAYKRLVEFSQRGNAMKLPKETGQLGRRMHALLESYYRLFYAYSDEGMNAIREEQRALQRALEEQLRKTTGDASVVCMHLCMVCQYTYDAFGSTTALRY